MPETDPWSLPRVAHTVLVADIGGTFVRFGLARAGQLLGTPVQLARDQFADLPAACRAFLAQQGSAAVQGASLAAAGQLDREGRLRMTNARWTLDPHSLGASLKLPPSQVLVLNDFMALAWILPGLREDSIDLIRPGPDWNQQPANRLVLGPGTGLGVAAALWSGQGWLPLASEGGHASFAPETDFEAAAGDRARERYGRASWERLVSGAGLELLYETARPEGPARSAAQITEACAQGDDPAAKLAVSSFVELVGAFAGDLALTLQAGGGVVLAGGILPRIARIRGLPGLRRRFEAKGRFSAWLAGVPLALLTEPQAALRGAALAYLGPPAASDPASDPSRPGPEESKRMLTPDTP